MKNARRFHLSFGPVALAFLLVAVACGGAAAKPAAAPTAAAKPAVASPTATPVAVATPAPTTAPAAVQPAGVLTIASRDLRSGSGIPRFCTAGCAENIYLFTILETLNGIKAGPGGPLDPQFDVPMLATSWKLDPGLKFMDFELRKGVQFHKGWGEMDAEDVAFSFNDANAVTQPESIHGQAGDFAPFIKIVKPTGKYSVRFEFITFYAIPFRYTGTFYQSAGIVSKKVFDKLGVDGMRDTFIGTGPFQMVEYKKDTSIVAEAVENHWRKTPAVKTVRILDIPETSSRVAMLETAEAQIAGELPFKDIVRLEKKGFKLNTGNGYGREESLMISGNYWEKKHPLTGEPLKVTLDPSKPWVGNPDDPASMERARKVRWALSLTIDREGLNKSLLEGRGKPCYVNQASISQPGWQDKWKIPYDPAKARQLLKEAGYEKGFDMPLYVANLWNGPELGDALAGIWQSELNIRVQIDRQVYTKFRPGLVQRTTPVPWLTTGDEGKNGFPIHWPKGFQGSALTTGGWGPGFEDPKYTETFLKMTYETDLQKRGKMAEEYLDYAYFQMLQPCMVEEPFHPMYNPQKVLQWELLPSMNNNLSGVNNLESALLAP